MGESLKGTSTSEENKNISVDDEIGDDFLTSWKLTTNGKDVMDFTAETPTRDVNKKFDFNKLEDFELGEDFGKLPSFKMDMADLDFTSPCRKTENSKERSGKGSVIRKKNENQTLFSFNFDFAELEDFGLDSNLLKVDEESKTDIKGFPKNDKKEHFSDSRSNSITSISVVEKGTKALSKSDEVNSLNSERMICRRSIDLTTCSTLICNKVAEDLVTLEEQITTTLGNDKKEGKIEEHRENMDMITSESLHAQRNTLDPCAQLNKQIPQEIISESQPENIVDTVIYKSVNGQEKNAELLSSPDSRSSSCLSAPKWKCPPTSESQPAKVTDNLEVHQNNENGANKETFSEEKSNNTMDVENTSVLLVSNRPVLETKNSNNNDSVLKSILSTMHRNALHPPSYSEKSRSSQSSASRPKQGLDVSCMSMEKLHVSTASQKRREPIVRTAQVLQKGSVSHHSDEKMERLTTQDDGRSKSEALKLKYKSPLSSFSMTGGIPHLKHSKIDSVEKVGVSSRRTDVISVNNILKTSRLKEITKQPENSTTQKKSQLVSIADAKMQTNSRNTPILARAEMLEKHVSLNPSLKRKSVEQTADPANLQSSKRSSQSPIMKRNCVGRSPQIHEQPVKFAINSEEMEDCAEGDHFSPQISYGSIPKIANIMDIEVPLAYEEDEHVQQAEACAKELDDICSMLKKKHEEAKDVLVRAVVNNNYLLMLNHPMHEEKIRSLRRLTRRLLSKESRF